MKFVDSTAKTNWALIGVVVVAALVVGAGASWVLGRQSYPTSSPAEIVSPTPSSLPDNTAFQTTSSLPTTCIDQPETTPVITSISPVSGLVGTKVEIRGCNFAGFEGDLDAVFVRSDGKEIPLYGGTWYPGYGGSAGHGKIVIVTVQSYCPSGFETGRYSGITSPCETIEVTPGVYKVYVTAWGKKSNLATFTIQPPAATVELPIALISPSGGEALREGETYIIRWTHDPEVRWVRISLYASNFPEVEKTGVSTAFATAEISSRELAQRGYMRWTPTQVSSAGLDLVNYRYFKVAVEGYTDAMPDGQLTGFIGKDVSDNPFSIAF